MLSCDMKDSSSFIKWMSRLGGRFFAALPFGCAISIISILVNQVATFLLSIIPIKIILIIGSGKVPKFIPEEFREYDQGGVILFFVGLAVLSFFLEILSKRIADNSIAGSVRTLISSNQKLVLFENQDAVADNAYRKFATATACLIYGFLAISLVFVLYPELACFLVLAIAILLIKPVSKVKKTDANIGEAQIDDLLHAPPQSPRRLPDFTFFLVVAFILVDFIFFSAPAFLFLLASAILSRQLVSRVNIFFGVVHYLMVYREKISAIFFRDHVLDDSKKSLRGTNWALLEINEDFDWVATVLRELLHDDISEYQVSWLQSGVKNLIFLKVVVPEDNGRVFLFKIFSSASKSKAIHEASLLIDYSEFLPCPDFMLATNVRGYSCHVFEITNLLPLEVGCLEDARKYFLAEVLSFSPSGEIVDQFSRSKSFLWTRINPDTFRRLRLVASREELHLVSELEANIEVYTKMMKPLPKRILPNGEARSFIFSDSGFSRYYLTQWTNWKIEPVGAGAISKRSELGDAFEAFTLAKQYVADLKHVPEVSFKVAALLYVFECEFRSQRYSDAFKTLQVLFSESGNEAFEAEDSRLLSFEG